jgi:hypothetical protein
MEATDWIGFIGVSLLLIAYFLNVNNKIAKDSLNYLLLNFIGAAIACITTLFTFCNFGGMLDFSFSHWIGSLF